MKRAILAATAGAALAFLAACDGSSRSLTGTASGTLATESRPVQGFTEISVSGAGHLVIQQTGVESLEITADEELLPHIQSEVVGERLVLGFRPGVSVTSAHEVLYRVTVGDLRAIEASGASFVEAHGVSTPALATVVSGASSFSASGVADAHVLVLSGASRCDAADLRSTVVTATLSGASYGLVRVSDALTSAVSGASTLEYFGDPVVTSYASGGSIVRRVGP